MQKVNYQKELERKLEQLQKAISSLVANGMDPKDVPLMAY